MSLLVGVKLLMNFALQGCHVLRAGSRGGAGRATAVGPWSWGAESLCVISN
jgi:hypothetical protein